MKIQRTAEGRTSEVAVAASAIRPGVEPVPPRARPRDAAEGTSFRHADARQDGRLAGALGDARWRLRWKAPLRPGMSPTAVLAAKDRVVVAGNMWQALDSSGAALAHGGGVGSPVVLDAESGRFQYVDADGAVTAHALADGAKLHFAPLAEGDVFARVFHLLRGGRIVTVGVEKALDPHGRKKPERSLVERIDVPASPKLGVGGVLLDSSRPAMLVLGTPRVVAAADAERLVLAAEGALLTVDLATLQVKSAHTGEFVPVALSLDEAGRAYLLADAAGRRRLWVVTAEGVRAAAFDLPEDATGPAPPPVVGHDHRVYLTAGRRLLAVEPDGRLAWERPLRAPAAGAAVTSDDRLLVCEGGELAAYDAEGVRSVVYAAEGDAFKSPPAMAPDGSIVVAGAASVHCLEPAR